MKRIIRIVLTEDPHVPAEVKANVPEGSTASGVIVTIEAEGFTRESLSTPPHAMLHALGLFLRVHQVPIEKAQAWIAQAIDESCDTAEAATEAAADRILREAAKA